MQVLKQNLFYYRESIIRKKKNCQIRVKHTLISDVQFKIIFPNATTKSKSFALLRP